MLAELKNTRSLVNLSQLRGVLPSSVRRITVYTTQPRASRFISLHFAPGVGWGGREIDVSRVKEIFKTEEAKSAKASYKRPHTVAMSAKKITDIHMCV